MKVQLKSRIPREKKRKVVKSHRGRVTLFDGKEVQVEKIGLLLRKYLVDHQFLSRKLNNDSLNKWI